MDECQAQGKAKADAYLLIREDLEFPQQRSNHAVFSGLLDLQGREIGQPTQA